MPRKKPIIPSQLPRISLALSVVEEMNTRLVLCMGGFALALFLITLGSFKPVTVYFHPVFSWLFVSFGSVLFILTTIELFQLRDFMQKNYEKILAFVFGVIFVVVLLYAAFAVPNPTAFQYTIFRIVLALAAAGVAGMFSGFLNIQISNWLKAGGALAVFAIVYFYAPAALEKLSQ
jgi:hypothetical protein